MKTKYKYLFTVILLFGINLNNYANCDTGGPGTSSCSISTSLTVVIVGASQTASVTCGAGYYACCNATIASATAGCVYNGSGQGNGEDFPVYRPK